jgi:hypothetical protein
MAWPTDSLTKTHFDAGTDSPSSARAELEALYDHVKLISAEVTDGETVWHSGNDGGGSGLDADKLDNEEGSFYRDASNINAGKIGNSYINTGSGNGLDSDLLDGQHGSYYNDLANATGTLTNNVDTDSLTVNGEAITEIDNVTQFYAGRVDSGGTTGNLPTSWSVALVSPFTNQYRITHSLGTTNYTVVATPTDSNANRACTCIAKTATTFDITTTDKGNSAQASPFDFILMVN